MMKKEQKLMSWIVVGGMLFAFFVLAAIRVVWMEYPNIIKVFQ